MLALAFRFMWAEAPAAPERAGSRPPHTSRWGLTRWDREQLAAQEVARARPPFDEDDDEVTWL